MFISKLVRDNIPEIIRDNGSECSIEILHGEEYVDMLENKLEEELNEYLDSSDTEELADLLEVIFAIAKVKGVSESELNEIRSVKRDIRGGFDKKILLVSTTD